MKQPRNELTFMERIALAEQTGDEEIVCDTLHKCLQEVTNDLQDVINRRFKSDMPFVAAMMTVVVSTLRTTMTEQEQCFMDGLIRETRATVIDKNALNEQVGGGESDA